MLPQPGSNVQDEELISDFEAARYASGDTPGQKTARNGSRTAKKRALSIGLSSNRSPRIRANSMALTPRRGRPRESIMVTPPVSPELDGPVLFRRKTNNSTATTIDTTIDTSIDTTIDTTIDAGGDSTLEDDVECSAMDTTIEDAVEESGIDEEVANLSEETSAAEHIKFVFFKLVEYLVLFILFSFLLSFHH